MSEACGGIYRLAYSEIRDAEDLLVALGGDVSGTPDAGAVERWTVIGSPMDDDTAAVGTAGDGVVRRGHFLDAVKVGDEALVLVGTVPVRLGPLGLTLWRAADDGATEESLAAIAAHEHGAHPVATESVRAAVAQMRRVGLLV